MHDSMKQYFARYNYFEQWSNMNSLMSFQRRYENSKCKILVQNKYNLWTNGDQLKLDSPVQPKILVEEAHDVFNSTGF